MIKKISIFLFSVIFLTAHTQNLKADSEFNVDSVVTYKVEETGKTLVTHDITLENLFSSVYATTYTLNLENINADNVNAYTKDGKLLRTELSSADQNLRVKVIFTDPVVGRGEKRNFLISYENSNFAVKTGEVWEISIPRLGETDSFRNYKINLDVPNIFGQEAYISPKPIDSSADGEFKRYSFSKESISQTGVTAGFGQFQVFSFNLSYHLENPLSVNSQTEIALPPDTAFQKVYFNKITPSPNDVRIDEDGNWLAVYKLTPRQRIDVNTEGSVQIFAGFRPFIKPDAASIQANLTPTGYWQSDDVQIKLLAQNLKTPQAIYDYVSKNLKYDLNRVKPNVQRMGAVAAYKNPSQAICIEFTDLFIAIARAAGIPAREINGFAYTENKDLQPLGLVADVLHAWPEYYDYEKGVWIPVDPTWGSTSGVDYFNKLDLRHFAFVIHGKSDTMPYPPGSYKLGPNPQKDVFVSFGTLPANRNSIPQLKLKLIRNIPFLDILYSAVIYNPGPVSMYSFYPTVYFDTKINARSEVIVLPPFSTYTSKIKVPYSLLGKSMPDKIKFNVSGSQIEVLTNKSQVVINSLIILFALFILILIFVLVKLKRINMDKIIATISSVYAKIAGKFTKNTNNA